MEDAQAIRKKQFKIMIGAAVGAVVVIVGALYWNDPAPAIDPKAAREKAASETMVNFATPGTQVRPEDKWMADGAKQVQGVAQQQYTLEQRIAAIEADKAAMQQRELEQRQGVDGSGTPMAGLNAQDARGLVGATVAKDLQPPPPPPMSAGSGTSIGFDQNNSVGNPEQPMIVPEIQVIDLGGGDTDKTQATAGETAQGNNIKVRKVNNFLPAGSFAKVVLLSGIDAPTGGQAASQALPVVMRVKSFARLPNYYRTNLKECFITANGYGDAASERAMIRTSKMSCVMTNGNAFEVDVKGHLSGEDGSFGMRGKVVSKQGALIWRGFLAGAFGGIGNSLAQQNQIVQQSALGTVTTMDPNKAFQSGLAEGMSTAANKVADFWLAQASQIFPVIEISAGRVGEVYLMEGIDFGEAMLTASADREGGEM